VLGSLRLRMKTHDVTTPSRRPAPARHARADTIRAAPTMPLPHPPVRVSSSTASRWILTMSTPRRDTPTFPARIAAGTTFTRKSRRVVVQRIVDRHLLKVAAVEGEPLPMPFMHRTEARDLAYDDAARAIVEHVVQRYRNGALAGDTIDRIRPFCRTVEAGGPATGEGVVSFFNDIGVPLPRRMADALPHAFLYGNLSLDDGWVEAYTTSRARYALDVVLHVAQQMRAVEKERMDQVVEAMCATASPHVAALIL